MSWRHRLLMAGAVGMTGVAAWVALACLGSGCSSMSYYSQSVGGHLDLMRRARPVAEVIADEATPAALRERLQLTQRLREFAVTELKLPDNASYRRYAELPRSAVVWNVVAAPELSLTLKTWCFPVMGCVGYRGYFHRGEADALATELRAQGLEADVYGVPAYSTLGWTNWLGGDPLLSTFVRWPELELARLLFHELAHQVVYVADDTLFNESFATAVERLGGRRWQASRSAGAAPDEVARGEQRRHEFRELTLASRAELSKLYASALSDADKRQRKAEIFAQMRAGYGRLKADVWAGFAGYDAWFERANNATLGVQAAYDDLVPGFERVFENQGRDFDRFYAEVRRLAGLPKAERQATLRRTE